MDVGTVFRRVLVHLYSPCMAVTLRDLIAVDGLALGPRTGELGLDRLVRWVAPTELADPTPWMDGGELILTTGLRQRTAAAQTAFVEKLGEAGAVGLGFGTGLSHNAVPRATLVAAQRIGLPVVEVPYETPFIAIAQYVAEKTAAERHSDQRRLVDAHDRLTQAVLAGDSLAQLIRTLSSQVGARTAVLAMDGSMLAGQYPPEIAHELTIDIGGTPVARLVAGPTSRTASLPYAARLAGVDLARRMSFQAGRRSLFGRLLRDLFEGRLSAEAAHWLLAAQGVHPEEPYRVLVGCWSDDRRGSPDENLRVLGQLAWSAQQFGTVVADPRALPAVPGADPCSAVLEDYLVVLVPPHHDVDEQVAGMIKALRLDPMRGQSAAVGVSELRGGAAGIERGYLEACAAVTGPGVHRCRPLTLFDLLLSRPNPAVRGLSEQILAPLVRFDAEHKAGLVETLRTYLATDGSVQATAEQLVVHRNTVRYRVDQIEKLTGRSLTATEDRTELWFALRAVDADCPRSAATASVRERGA
jgi:PucR family transcriptional regulator, purine catabolism regulatory protein